MLRARELGDYLGRTVKTILDAANPSTLMLLNTFDRPPSKHNPADDGPLIHLGDLTHALPPFSAIGANMAMMDNWDSAAALTQDSDLFTAVESLEQGIPIMSSSTHRTSKKYGHSARERIEGISIR